MDNMINTDQRRLCKISWKYINQGISEFIDFIEYTGIKFDRIVAIKRGGWIPGVMLSNKLDIPLIDSTYLEYNLINDQNILIVDDIFDTGCTINIYYNIIKDMNPHDYFVYTLFYRHPVNLTRKQEENILKMEDKYGLRSVIIPHYRNYAARNYWIVFPWEDI